MCARGSASFAASELRNERWTRARALVYIYVTLLGIMWWCKYKGECALIVLDTQH